MGKTKLNTRKILLSILWFFISAGAVVLLVAAVRSKNTKTCQGIEIEISGVSNNFFIDKADVLNIVKKFATENPVGKTVSSFNLGEIESSLEKDVWIKNAELFFDNNDVLRISIDEREPVARVFSKTGKSFYIDSSIRILPLSDKFSARLPVFTGYAGNANFVSKADSSLLRDIKEVSTLIQADSFLMAMIEQVDITSQRKFEMLPKIGRQVIVFGTAENAEQKFEKLRMFYKQVMTKSGWSKYSEINLEYKNQVLAKIRDAVDKTSDSLRALQLMSLIAEQAERRASDSVQFFLRENNDRGNTDSSMIQQSMQRDETETEAGFIPAEEPLTTTATAPAKPVDVKAKTATDKKPAVTAKPAVAKKPVSTKPALPKKPVQVKPPAQKPKAVMQKQ